METEIISAKIALRAQMRATLERISSAVRAVESICLCDLLRPQMRSAGTILFFAPLDSEIDVWPLLEECLNNGKTVALPWFNPAMQTYQAREIAHPTEDVATGKYGVREPAAHCLEIPWEQINLVLVPGLAFDSTGNRLGRGKGYYDRLLKETKGIKCGICHTLQLLPQIPAEPHDTKVDFIFTPDRSFRAKPKVPNN